MQQHLPHVFNIPSKNMNFHPYVTTNACFYISSWWQKVVTNRSNFFDKQKTQHSANFCHDAGIMKTCFLVEKMFLDPQSPKITFVNKKSVFIASCQMSIKKYALGVT